MLRGCLEGRYKRFQDQHYEIEKDFHADLFEQRPETTKYKHQGIKAIGPWFGIGQLDLHRGGRSLVGTQLGAKVFHPAQTQFRRVACPSEISLVNKPSGETADDCTGLTPLESTGFCEQARESSRAYARSHGWFAPRIATPEDGAARFSATCWSRWN